MDFWSWGIKIWHRIKGNERKIGIPYQMWETVIKDWYIAGSGRIFYIINYIGVYTRKHVVRYADYSVNSKEVVRALNRVIRDEKRCVRINFLAIIRHNMQKESLEEYCSLKTFIISLCILDIQYRIVI